MSDSKALLIRFSSANGAAFAASTPKLGIAGSKFEVEPLFSTSDAGLDAGLGVAKSGGNMPWYLATPHNVTDVENQWDLAHKFIDTCSKSPSLTGGAVPDIIEPDLVQQWPFENRPSATGLGAAGCVFEDQNASMPTRQGEFAWHLDDAFSQLRRARDAVKTSGSVVRIVHLDTGYDPNHSTLPTSQLEFALQKNFVDSGSTNDATDPGNSGLLRNPGHGTATLCILAGGHFRISQSGYNFDDQLGAVPNARIVPVRIGNSVVQLTTSSVVKGINYAVELCNSESTRVHVISMSMGGVASAAWADAVNNAYEAGIIYVAAAGNNYSAGLFGFPTHQIVYPARFRRVIAACGVMADRRPYYGLKAGTMQGNWGPEGSMATAMSAFTPNVPWARWGCRDTVSMDGAGTSSATPQIAAAAAMYLQKHFVDLLDPAKYPEPWMRVEAVRNALFSAADKTADNGKSEKLGNGVLQAAATLAVSPTAATFLRKTPRDSAGFPFLNVLSGTALTNSGAERMLQLEATQLVQRWDRSGVPNPLEEVIADPDRDANDISRDKVLGFLEVVSEHPNASDRLKSRAKAILDGQSRPSSKGNPQNDVNNNSTSTENKSPASSKRSHIRPPVPAFRKLRGYAVDPSLTTSLDTVGIGETTFKIPWEPLKEGPVGEYLEVMDIDPASNAFYAPVALDDPILLAQDGLPPAEGVPQFHQQMVYTICSLTIKNFERALGRKSLWRPGPPKPGANKKDDSNFVQRLRVYPHALREPNAYYSPDKIALLFGYFNSQTQSSGDSLPGGRIFTCLSHDIVAHETTHALLDGMHRRFLLPSNRDVHAFHEGFADCVAMLQHFTFPELVAHQISITKGSIDSQENLLVQLASQFGQATGKRTALRDAIGELKDNVWVVRKADPTEYERVLEPHDRGRILVSAVFDAFLSIYKRRTADLMRLATGGTGILRPGAVHPDLVNRLASEAGKSAQHVLLMCIRALDYCPPTDITFGEYLRAIITADCDLVADDDLDYRVSFLEAFRRRGIFPIGVRSLSVSSLRWRSPEEEDPQPSANLLKALQQVRGPGLDHMYAESRQEIFELQREMRQDLHGWLAWHLKNDANGKTDGEFLGIDYKKRFEVHNARIAFRSSPDGETMPQLLLEILQTSSQPVDPRDPKGPSMSFEGGCTIIADLRRQKVRYCIRKKIQSTTRLGRQQEFGLSEFDSLRSTYLGFRSLDDDSTNFGKEPFALIHRSS